MIRTTGIDHVISLLVALTLVLYTAADGYAFSIVEQVPNIDRFQNFTVRPMRVTFDASIDTSTVSSTTVFIHEEGDPSAELAVQFSFDTVSIVDDTLVVTPTGNDGRWPFAERLILNVTAGLTDAGGAGFDGAYPWGQVFVANIPNDMDVLAAWDPTDPFDFVDAFVNANVLVGYNPLDPESTDLARPETIPGMGATEAWKLTAGRPDVLIAVVDDGSERYDYAELEENYFLNRGELPAPTNGGSACSPDPYDCNDDGRLNVRDYDDDPAFDGLGRPVTIYDLLDTFSDGYDDDNNGLSDDICGWDFLRNTNEALGVRDFPEGGHGEDRARDAAGVADNGVGDKPGYCPHCMVLPVRISASVMAEMNLQGAGVAYAYEMGAAVAVFASETLSYSGEVNKMFTRVSEGGMLLVAVTSDEMSYHHAYSGACDDTISVKSIFPLPPLDFLGFFPMSLVAFTETYCTMWGETVHLAASSGACSSEAAGNVAGMAGLIISRARDLGIELTANEVKQILTMSADDIHRFCLTFTGGTCHCGWDAHFGYGRPNAPAALAMLGDPDEGIEPAIPPEVKFRAPAWFAIADPVDEPLVDVEAYIYARDHEYRWELQAAAGKEPAEEEFAVFASGTASDAIDGPLGQVDISGLLTPEVFENPPTGSFDFIVTLRLQAAWDLPGRGAVTGEDRRTIALHRDQGDASGLLDGFPINMGSSGEGSVVTYDLDGDVDGRLELIVAGADGLLRVLKYDGSTGQYDDMAGFPVDVNALSGIEGPDFLVDAPIVSPAVGDLFGDGVPYIVVPTAGGSLLVIHRDGVDHPGGPVLDGFPVFSDEPDNTSPEGFAHGRGFYSAPVLGDLDKDGLLEIVLACFDSKVYVWRPVDDDGDGSADPVSGFPVFCKSAEGNVDADKVCHGELACYTPLILGTPVLGVFDPDATDPDIAAHPSIFIGTSEACGSALLKTTRFYGIYHDGYDNDSGSAFLPGFPLMPYGPLSDLLPLPPVTLGITSTPAMARYKGRTWIGIGSAIWPPQLFEWDGFEMRMHTLPSTGFNALAHGSFGRLGGDDRLFYVLPISSAIDTIDDWISLLKPVLEAWDLDALGDYAFSMKMEDSNWYLGASIADITGDGRAEMIAGSGGFLVHGVDVEGNVPAGWPKFTYGWSVSSPTVSDVDGDSMLEVFNYTREGYLFGWRSQGPACDNDGGAPDWWTDHRDERHTGMFGTDTQPPLAVTDIDVTREGDRYRFTFTAPGDDWRCGTVAGYDVRYAATEAALADAFGFEGAQAIDSADLPDPVQAGNKVTFKTTLADHGLWFAVRSVDDAGNLSLVSPAVQATVSGVGSDDCDRGCGCALFDAGDPSKPQFAVMAVLCLVPFGFILFRLRRFRRG